MPSWKDLLAAAGHSGPGLTLTALLLAARAAVADHGVPAPTRTGLGWTSWLFVVGAVIAVGLAAWAFFAPDRGEGSSRATPLDGSPLEPPRR